MAIALRPQICDVTSPYVYTKRRQPHKARACSSLLSRSGLFATETKRGVKSLSSTSERCNFWRTCSKLVEQRRLQTALTALTDWNSCRGLRKTAEMKTRKLSLCVAILLFPGELKTIKLPDYSVSVSAFNARCTLRLYVYNVLADEICYIQRIIPLMCTDCLFKLLIVAGTAASRSLYKIHNSDVTCTFTCLVSLLSNWNVFTVIRHYT